MSSRVDDPGALDRSRWRVAICRESTKNLSAGRLLGLNPLSGPKFERAAGVKRVLTGRRDLTVLCNGGPCSGERVPLGAIRFPWSPGFASLEGAWGGSVYLKRCQSDEMLTLDVSRV